MEHDFLDGIDEAFQDLIKLNGNGKRNGQAATRSKEENVVSEILEHLQRLSRSQREEVLRFVRSLEKPKVD
jgi:hypothetical protein